MDAAERNTLLCPDGKTYSNFDGDENLAFFRTSVRTGNYHGALQCVLEAIMAGDELEDGILHQIYVTISEEIGPTNPSLIMLIHRFLWSGEVDQQILAMLIELMAKSPKDRLFTVLCRHLRTPVVEISADHAVKRLKFLLIKLDVELEDQNFEASVDVFRQIYWLDQENPHLQVEKHDWKNFRKEFNAPAILIKQRKLITNAWLPIIGMAMRSTQKVCNLVCYLYNISVTKSDRIDLQCVHAIWSICNPKQVAATWYETTEVKFVTNSKYPQILLGEIKVVAELLQPEERLAMIEAHRRRENIVPICAQE
uniref:Uncharacterized protein n=1 Tax=viral metagenome TaxID=1070528 RepID=A0A6C0CIY7_9ZZZZ